MFLHSLLQRDAWSSNVVQVLIGLSTLFLTSQISIPLHPVPITLQTVGVMMVALSLPQRAALQSIFSYVALGALGLPIFAGFSGGFAKLLGPTGGYLIGFIAAVYLMARAKTFLGMTSGWRIFINCAFGQLCIYIFGIAWLAYVLGSLDKAITLGLVPFIFPGIMKAFLLAFSFRYIHRK